MIGVDPWRRIDFYVGNGLVPRRPTAEQLEAASRLNQYEAGVIERVKRFVRNPMEMLPTKAKREILSLSNEEILAGIKTASPEEAQAIRAKAAAAKSNGGSNGSHANGKNGSGNNGNRGGGTNGHHEAWFDRTLKTACLISPVRFALMTCYNPWNAIPSTGLSTPMKYLVSHVVHAPHPTALWDVQIIHADEGGIDLLASEVRRAKTGRGLTPRIYRALAQRPGYYEYLEDLIPRVRRFDYPPTPAGFNPVLENLVNFLNYAAKL
jgi:hypothetical protein